MTSVIETHNLTKNYNGFVAVDNISFNVMKGEIFGFLGPNGAGKTTTINMLIGMAKISAGKVLYNNLDLTKNIEKIQNIIGVVADESNLYDEMTGFDNLCFCGSLYGLPKKTREKRARELLEQFQLLEAANKKFKAYSKGMKRKLTIAAALIHEPEILFLDEPTTGLDIASVRQIRNLIKDLHEKGTTIFFTTHYIEEAEHLCSRVAFISKGKILQIDSVKRLLEESNVSTVLEVLVEKVLLDKDLLLQKLKHQFPNIECLITNDKIIKVISTEKMDISPIVSFLSSEKISILEVKLDKPSLEDIFVKITGIELDKMKKEKEKK
ncbi:MAG: ABC transporter ATP-binding protein [Candidatus Heimdallarchaeaceae archaeon]